MKKDSLVVNTTQAPLRNPETSAQLGFGNPRNETARGVLLLVRRPNLVALLQFTLDEHLLLRREAFALFECAVLHPHARAVLQVVALHLLLDRSRK